MQEAMNNWNSFLIKYVYNKNKNSRSVQKKIFTIFLRKSNDLINGKLESFAQKIVLNVCVMYYILG